MREDEYECSLVPTHQHRVRWNGDRCAVPVSLCKSNNGFRKSESEIFDDLHVQPKTDFKLLYQLFNSL